MLGMIRGLRSFGGGGGQEVEVQEIFIFAH